MPMETIENRDLETSTGGAYYVPVPACHAPPSARPAFGPYPAYVLPRAAWWPAYNAYPAYNACPAYSAYPTYNAYGGWVPPPPPRVAARRAWWW